MRTNWAGIVLTHSSASTSSQTAASSSLLHNTCHSSLEVAIKIWILCSKIESDPPSTFTSYEEWPPGHKMSHTELCGRLPHHAEQLPFLHPAKWAIIEISFGRNERSTRNLNQKNSLNIGPLVSARSDYNAANIRTRRCCYWFAAIPNTLHARSLNKSYIITDYDMIIYVFGQFQNYLALGDFRGFTLF